MTTSQPFYGPGIQHGKLPGIGTPGRYEVAYFHAESSARAYLAETGGKAGDYVLQTSPNDVTNRAHSQGIWRSNRRVANDTPIFWPRR